MAPSALTDIAPTRNREKRAAPLAIKKNRSVVSLVLAGLIVIFLLVGLVRMFSKPAAPDTVTVVAAGKDLPPGCQLGFRDLHYLTIPKSYYTQDMPKTYGELAGRYTATYIAMGEPISTNSLLPGTRPLSDQLGTHQRAFTLKLNEDALVDHAIVPGDHVDVIATTVAKNGSKYTKTVCQNVLVLLAVPRSMLLSDKLRSTDINKITLAVSPQSAELLSQAVEVGKVRVVLRNRTNSIAAVLPGADDRDLVPASAGLLTSAVLPPTVNRLWSDAAKQAALSPLPPPPPPPPAILPGQAAVPAALGWVVEVFQGAKKESHEFPGQQ